VPGDRSARRRPPEPSGDAPAATRPVRVPDHNGDHGLDHDPDHDHGPGAER
jgi:hypothetical protein